MGGQTGPDDRAMQIGAEIPELAAHLANLPLGATIPREVYVAVAVVLSWVYWMEGRSPPQSGAESGPL
jgi:type III secretion system FlhB-like substrate exporter